MTYESFQKNVARYLGVLCSVVFVALVLDVLWGVFTREVLDAQPAWTQELATFLLVWLALLGGVLAYADDRHLGVDILVTKMHPDSKRITRFVTHLCVLGFSITVLIIGGVQLFTSRWESGQELPAMGIRKAWFYSVLPLCGVLITILSAGKLLATFKQPTEQEVAQ